MSNCPELNPSYNVLIQINSIAPCGFQVPLLTIAGRKITSNNNNLVTVSLPFVFYSIWFWRIAFGQYIYVVYIQCYDHTGQARRIIGSFLADACQAMLSHTGMDMLGYFGVIWCHAYNRRCVPFRETWSLLLACLLSSCHELWVIWFCLSRDDHFVYDIRLPYYSSTLRKRLTFCKLKIKMMYWLHHFDFTFAKSSKN